MVIFKNFFSKLNFKTFQIIQKVLVFIYKYNKLYIFISIFYSIFQGILPIISILSMQRLINGIQLKNISFKAFLVITSIYIVLEFLSLFASNIYNLYSVKFTKDFSKKVELNMLKKANNLSIQDYEDPSKYDIINRAQNQNGENLINFFNLIISVLQNLITISSSTIIIANYKLWILLVTIIAPVIQFYISNRIGKEQYDINLKRTSQERKCWYINYLILLGNAKKETLLFDIGDYFVSQYSILKEKFIQQDYKILKKSFKFNSFISVASQFFSTVVHLSIFISGYIGKIHIGDLTTYIACVSNVQSGFEIALSQMTSLYRESLYINLLFDFFCLEENALIEKHKEVKIKNIHSIELKNVSYKFKYNSSYILKNINLRINDKEIVSFVGKNGSGKSTLIKIILGFYNDYEGTVLINGIDLKHIDTKSFYKHISCVFQDFNRYETSIRENIAYGNIEEMNNNILINEILGFAEFDTQSIVNNDLDTVLGHWFGEKELSGGQWQKIAISRALIKKADLFILDEPDSALDVFAEIDMLKSYKNMLDNKMGVFISHNISHVSLLSDCIFVIDNGEIIESGVHQELIERDGLYSKLYLSQNLESTFEN